MKKILGAVAVVVAAVTGLLIWAAGGLQSPSTEIVEALTVDGVDAATTDTSTIVVVTWNVGWGFGAGSEGSGALKSPEEMARGLAALGKSLAELDPDVAFIQEIDFDADRSQNVDQAIAIARAAGMRFVAEGVSWRTNYLPFPYWPPSGHWGAIVSGGAILSKHPLSDCTVQTLPKPAGAPWWYRPFYLFRYLQACTATVGGKKIRLYNTHLDAFYQPNRIEQAEQIAELIGAGDTDLAIFGGDFNTVQPEASQRAAYDDEPETDHAEDRTVLIIRAIEGLRDVLAPSEFAAHEQRYFTFPAHAPTRKLDYIFIGHKLLSVETRVPTEVGTTSDHLPVLSRIVLPR